MWYEAALVFEDGRATQEGGSESPYGGREGCLMTRVTKCWGENPQTRAVCAAKSRCFARSWVVGREPRRWAPVRCSAGVRKWRLGIFTGLAGRLEPFLQV